MKILMVTNSNESKWGSCKSIIKNLKATYQLMAATQEVHVSNLEVNLDEQIKEYEFISIINEIEERLNSEKYDRLIFVDDKIFPVQILEGLALKMRTSDIPPILIHIFGDFTYFARQWSTFLLNHSSLKINFVTASDAQNRLIQNLVGNHIESDVFPFPLDEKDFFYSDEKRKEARQKYNLADNKKVLLYSGRINLQKNVDVLLKSFAEIAMNDDSYHLWIAGDFDDLGAPILGIFTGQNYMFHKITSLVKGLPPQIADRIKFWGTVEKEVLLDFYLAADLFVSLSLYHDEDFGMAPAEALMTGLSSVLTNWGGYSSFASDKWECGLVNATIVKNGFVINKNEVKQAILKVLSQVSSIPRQTRSDNFKKCFSYSSTFKRLKDIVEKDPKMISFPPHNLVLLSMKKNEFNKKEDYFNLIPSTDGIYSNIYSSYIP